MRAAAICRWLDSEVTVLRSTDDPNINRALDHFGIPYKVFATRTEAVHFVEEVKPKTLVLDDRCNSVLDSYASLYIWRMGRPVKPRRPIPMVRIEGPGALFPIVMLDDSEILSREEAREDLGLPQDEPLTIGVPSTCRPGVVESANPDYMLREWPAIRWMRAADTIIGCIGANLYGEVAYVDLPARWIKAPNAKDQALRIWEMPQAPVMKDAAKHIATMIEDAHRRA